MTLLSTRGTALLTLLLVVFAAVAYPSAGTVLWAYLCGVFGISVWDEVIVAPEGPLGCWSYLSRRGTLGSFRTRVTPRWSPLFPRITKIEHGQSVAWLGVIFDLREIRSPEEAAKILESSGVKVPPVTIRDIR